MGFQEDKPIGDGASEFGGCMEDQFRMENPCKNINIHEPDTFKPDSIVQEIIQNYIERAKFGKKKYNTDLDRTDLTVQEWYCLVWR